MNPLKMLSRGGAVSEPSDADFENVTLLLHGDGTNGAQNNTFLDSSTNNFTITRNGNTTQGTFSPFSKVDGRWGNYFDGANDNLSIAANAAFLYTGDFTVEMWVYPTRFVDFEFLFGTGGSGTQDQANIYANGTYVYFDGTNSVTSPTLNLNAWNHIAVTRSGTTIRAYANGVSGTSQTKSGNLGSSANAFRIGERSDGVQDFNGYISNLRVVNGTAVYTGSTYTVPTTPLTAITNTSLLTCQSNRFKDNSSNNFTITRNGDVRVTPFSPFPTLTAYDAATNGGSGYFDGSGDWLGTASNSAFDFGTGSFTLECWFNKQGAGAYSDGVGNVLVYTGNGSFNAVWLGITNSGTIIGKIGFNFSGWVSEISGGTAVDNAWNHVAFVRNGSTVNLYLNGVSVANTTNSTDLSTYGTNSSIGVNYNSDRYFKGYIASARINKSAVYTTGFTPATSPFTAIANTSLLCNFTNAGIIDNSMSNNLETVGNAQIDTTTKKYGTGSMEFDGTGDYLVMAGNAENFAFGTGDFTIEMWVYVNSLPGTDMLLYDGRPSNGAYPCIILQGSTNKIIWYVNTGIRITATNVAPTTTWFHLAIARSGTSTKMFVDGTQSGSTYTDSTNYLGSASRPYIGANAINGTESFNGFIDDLRITKGKARYTSNFTPPTAALPDIGE